MLGNKVQNRSVGSTGFYGWRIVWALALTTTLSYGILYYAFSVMVQPMEAEMGWGRGQTSLGYSIFVLLCGAMAIPYGRWVDRNGARGLMTFGSVVAAALLVAWSKVQSLGGLYVVMGLLGCAAAALFYETAFTVVAAWFYTQRSRATWLITLIAGFASTVFIPLTAFLVEHWGWRAALQVLALLQLLGTAPLHLWVLRRKPADLGLERDGLAFDASSPPESKVAFSEALRLSRFWWLSGAFALQSGIAVSLAAHLVALLGELKHTPALVAASAGAIGAIQVLGRVLFAPLEKQFSMATVAYAIFGLRLVALGVLLLAGKELLGIAAFVFLYGITNGVITLIRAGLVSRLFGSAHFGSINGAMYSIMTLVQALAPFGAGLLHNLHQDYSWVIGAWMLAAGVSMGFLWKAGLTKSTQGLRY